MRDFRSVGYNFNYILGYLAFIFSITAQTGNGITTQTSSPYALTPTSVDSTTTVSIQFHNTVCTIHKLYDIVNMIMLHELRIILYIILCCILYT